MTLFETEIVKQNNWSRLNLMGMGFNFQPTNQEKAKKFLEGQLLWGNRWGSGESSDFFCQTLVQVQVPVPTDPQVEKESPKKG